MEIDFALLADAATVDGSGKLNVLGVFDRIRASEFPARHGRIALVLRFSARAAEAGAREVGILLRDPEGGEVLRLNGRMELGGGPAQEAGGIRVPHVLNLDGITFPEPGMYAFDILVEGERMLSVPLRLERVPGRGPGDPRAAGGGPPPPFAFGPGESAEA